MGRRRDYAAITCGGGYAEDLAMITAGTMCSTAFVYASIQPYQASPAHHVDDLECDHCGTVTKTKGKELPKKCWACGAPRRKK